MNDAAVGTGWGYAEMSYESKTNAATVARPEDRRLQSKEFRYLQRKKHTK